MKRRVSALKASARVALLLATLALTACAFTTRDRGPFEGKIVVADTGQPVAGAAVFAFWSRIVSEMGGSEFYEVRLAVTDTQGRFEIPRLPMIWRLGVQPATFRWFAPGYATVNVVLDSSPTGARVPTFIEMRELKYLNQETLRTLPIRMYDGLPPGLPDETREMLHRVVNEKRQVLGLPPVGAPYTWRVPYTLPAEEERRAPEARPPADVPLPPPPFLR